LQSALNISDRILVSRVGRVVEEFDPEVSTEAEIMFAAVH
jgi:simple sugar transport system ATP-binding protein